MVYVSVMYSLGINMMTVKRTQPDLGFWLRLHEKWTLQAESCHEQLAQTTQELEEAGRWTHATFAFWFCFFGGDFLKANISFHSPRPAKGIFFC